MIPKKETKILTIIPLMPNRKAQGGAVTGLIFGFLLVAVFSIILSPLMEFINIGLNSTGASVHSELINTIISILPVFMALVVLVAIVVLITGRQA